MVVLGLVLAGLILVCCWRFALVRRRRRRDAATMFVTTYPDIELEQRYGGWNADAYDAGTGHDRSEAGVRLVPGPPWIRARPR
jgi:hypothetical protein